MARLNIEESWFSDPRRSKLISILGSTRLADGLAIELWRFAQCFKGKECDLEKVFDSNEINTLTKANLIKLEQNGTYYVFGSKKHFSWLNDRSSAGKMGGSSKSHSNNINHLNEAKLSKDKQAATSYSSSYSYSSSNSSSNEKNDPTKLFEDQFHGESNMITAVIKEFFEQVPSEMKKHKKNIYDHYEGDAELFRKEFSDLIESGKRNCTDASGIRRWVGKSLKEMVGW